MTVEQILHMPSIEAMRGCRDSFALYDLPGLADAADRAVLNSASHNSWMGGSLAGAVDGIRHGNLANVEASDALMGELEDCVFVSRKFRVIDDVCGAMPNVPAFIAGLPTSMRRRARTVAQAAPLSVFIDLTSSANIDAAEVSRRGMAALALVRLLTNVRPVELWAMCGLGQPAIAAYCAVRIETAPLDLARAAHVLTSTAVVRGLMYKLACEACGRQVGGWPNGCADQQRKHGAEILARVVHPGSDVLFVPPIHSRDTFDNPVAWIKTMLAEYGGQTVEATD